MAEQIGTATARILTRKIRTHRRGRSSLMEALMIATLLGACSSPAVPAGGGNAADNTTATKPAGISVPAGTYELDPAHSYLVWTISHLGVSNYMGRFARVVATLTLDPANPAASSVIATIDPNSLKVGEFADYKKKFADKPYQSFDEEISRSPSFLNSALHPKITFRSTAIKLTGDRTGTMTGDLTFLGVTKSVTLDVTFNGDVIHPMKKIPIVGFAAKGQFKRSDFGMAIGPVGDVVTIAFDGEFDGGGAPASGQGKPSR